MTENGSRISDRVLLHYLFFGLDCMRWARGTDHSFPHVVSYFSSRVLTPASSKVAISLCACNAASMILIASTAPVPSPSRS